MAASLRKAINWLIDNEDLNELIDQEFDTEETGVSTVSMALVADLFDKTEQDIADLLFTEWKRRGLDKG